jgi:hypothetical protein
MKQLIAFPLIRAVAQEIIHRLTPHHIAKTQAKRLLIMGLACLLIGWWTTPIALAKVQFLQEADQWIYQAQHTVPDTDGRRWEVTALKQMEADSQGFYLRLIPQSITVHFDTTRPLLLKTASGKQLTASNVTRQYFTDALPVPNIGQYDIQPLLPQLQAERSLQLQLPGTMERTITISITSDILAEWTTVGACVYLMCTIP